MGKKVVGNTERVLKKSGSLVCIAMLVFAALLLTEMMITPTASAGTVPPATISTDTTWNSTGSPYWIEYDVTVNSTATLTIEPGVEVRFNGPYSLIIDGNLVAIGDSTNKINFTSNLTSPRRGDWQSIRFNEWNTSSNFTFSTIKYATIEFATYGVHCHNRSIGLENSTVSNNTIGVYSTLASYPYIANNKISNNRQHGIDWSNDLDMAVKVWNHTTNMIWNNTIYDNGNNGINLAVNASTLIEGNNISYNEYGIYMNNSMPWVLNNSISNNTKDGIYMIGNYLNEEGADLENNTIANNGGNLFESGIRLISSANNTISNNVVYSNYGKGIFLDWESNNNIVVNNTAFSNNNGIELRSSKNNTIEKNNASSNDMNGGIIITYSSNNNTVTNNTAINNGIGIYLVESSYNILSNNMMVADGIIIGSSTLKNWNTHTIDTTNTVNGNPIYYWRNQTGGTVPSGAGEVILANCTNVTVENQNVSNGSGGIELGFSSKNTVTNNTASSNKWFGVLLYRSDNNTIIGNDALNNMDGIYLYQRSNNNTITDNNALNNNLGIGFSFSSDNIITNNTVSSNNEYGLWLYFLSNNNSINNNAINWNSASGIYIYDNSSANIALNNVSNNTNHGIYIGKYSNATIDDNNTIAGNTQGIYLYDHSTSTITWNDIHNNTDAGINCTSSSDATIHYNNIEDNLHDLSNPTSGYGVNNQDWMTITINATYNWWGDSSGPYHSTNLLGQGNQVTNGVDFRPYSSSRF